MTQAAGCTEQDAQDMEQFIEEVVAIARGVEARYYDVVTERTAEIARQLGIPEKQIQRWVSARSLDYSERNKTVKFSLENLRNILT